MDESKTQMDVDTVVSEYDFEGDYGCGNGVNNPGLSYEDMLGIAEQNGWNDDIEFLKQAIDKWYELEN